ncbi:MAG: hypothetical protein LBU22_07325 [Dysgonamonadaceae bacterium]|jgi:hypothetical protein|nr:hypothetical protein [Dysgonamonadaceae bacterium]
MIKKVFSAIIIASCTLFCGSSLNAQGLFENWAIGIEGGTYGPGITVATSLSSHLKLKAGVDYLGVKYTTDFEIKPEGYVENSSSFDKIDMTGTVSNPQLKFTNFKAILDYYPMKNGIFSFSAGIYAGNSAITADAQIDDYQQLVSKYGGPLVFDLEDIVIKPSADGTFDGKVKFGNTIKPYFGLGLGRTIANSRVGFKFDIGILYQGDYKFESKNMAVSQETAKGITTTFFDDESIPTWVLKTWPIINFSLSYRIF